jgi:hypothetical protein
VGDRDPRGAPADELPEAAFFRVVEPEGRRRCDTQVKSALTPVTNLRCHDLDLGLALVPVVDVDVVVVVVLLIS